MTLVSGADLAKSVCCYECRSRLEHRQRQRLTLYLRVRQVCALLLRGWEMMSFVHGVVVEEGRSCCRCCSCCWPRWPCGIEAVLVTGEDEAARKVTMVMVLR